MNELRQAIEELIAPQAVRDAVKGRTSEVRKVHVRVRDLRAILEATERNACDIANITPEAREHPDFGGPR